MPFFVLWGCLLALLATSIFRVAGQFFINPEELSLLIFACIATIPLIAATTYPVYAWKKVSDSERPLAAVCIALPGMFLDIFTVSSFQSVFANMSPTANGYFAGALLWGYSLILLTGFTFKKQTHKLQHQTTTSVVES